MLITVVYEGAFAGNPSTEKNELVVRFHGANIENIAEIKEGNDAAKFIQQKIPDVVLNTYFASEIGEVDVRGFERKSITLLDDGKRDLLFNSLIQQSFVAELVPKSAELTGSFQNYILTLRDQGQQQYVYNCVSVIKQMLLQCLGTIRDSDLMKYQLKHMTIDIRRKY